MAEIGTDILKAKALLEAGELVAIPTETVYGLAGNALNVESVAKIFTAKNRPRFDPLIVHVPDIGKAQDYVTAMPEKARLLAKHFWPGPLTLLLKKKPCIPDLVTAGMDTVGIRCPHHILTQTLLRSLDFPLAAPSANPFGYVSPTQPAHVDEQLGDRIQYILDGGACEIGIESTIIGFEDGIPAVYRTGGVSIEALEEVVGKVTLPSFAGGHPVTPGQLKSHYAPGKKVIIGKIEELLQEYPAHCSGILTFQNDFNSPFQFILSPSGTLEEAAKNLFAGLRFFEKMPVEVILTEMVPDVGLGRAINDRLKRAASE